MKDTPRDLALLAMRLSGLLLAAHGWGKVARLAAGETGFINGVRGLGFPLPGLFAWAAALSELAGVLVAVGLCTRVAAAFGAFTMAVAAFAQHRAHLHFLVWIHLMQRTPEQVETWGDPELALVYLCLLLGVALLGPGAISLDRRLRGKT